MYGSRQAACYWEKLRFKLERKILRFAWSSWSKKQVRWGINIPLFKRVSNDPKMHQYFLHMEKWLMQNAHKS